MIVSPWKPSFAVLTRLWDKLLPAAIAVAVAAIGVAAGDGCAQEQTSAPPRRSIQRAPALPLTKFYNTPDPLPAGKPGELIRSQEFDHYELPFSVSATRILYHSRSATGEDVASSGVVLMPYDKKPPAGGWPVIAWAHRTAGVARTCAPSLTRNLGHGPFLAMYVNLGYAVVATDYVGLGTSFRNAFLDGPSNAADVINAIGAARAAVPQLGARWVVLGEDSGGLAAVAAAERENEIGDPNFLGSIAISDLTGVREIYEHGAPSAIMLATLAYGVKTVYRQFQVTDILTQKALGLYNRAEQACSDARTIPSLSPAEVLKPGWERNTFVGEYFDRNELGWIRARGPILVISAGTDQTNPSTVTARTITRMCKQGDRVQWERYSQPAPGSLIGDSVRDQIGWIEARFAGRPSPSNCR